MGKENIDNNSDDRNWKYYDATIRRVELLEQRQSNEDAMTEKWLMTVASGSFGLSFAFIDQIVKIENASHFEFLVTSWSCFILVIILGITGFIVSSFCHSSLVKEENGNLSLIYAGKKPKYKKRSLFFSPNAVLQYISVLLLVLGLVFIMLFIAKNLLK